MRKEHTQWLKSSNRSIMFGTKTKDALSWCNYSIFSLLYGQLLEPALVHEKTTLSHEPDSLVDAFSLLTGILELVAPDSILLPRNMAAYCLGTCSTAHDSCTRSRLLLYHEPTIPFVLFFFFYSIFYFGQLVYFFFTLLVTRQMENGQTETGAIFDPTLTFLCISHWNYQSRQLK